jgi:hypothetical protein
MISTKLKFAIKCVSVVILLAIGANAFANQAQQVPVPEDPSTSPQIEISGTGVGTAGYSKNIEHTGGEGIIDFADSALRIGGAQKLYDGGAIGSFGIGWLTLDQTNKGSGQGSTYFPYQTYVDFQSESYEALIGRTDNPISHLVDFPTLREDDLITLTNPLNPFSSGENVEEHRYSNSVSVTANQNLKYFENIHAQHLIASSSAVVSGRADGGADAGLNSAGVTFEYLGNVGMEAFERVPSWGAGIEHISVTSSAPGGINQIFAGGVFNLTGSVVHRMDFRLQDIASLGSELRILQNTQDSFQADSNSFAAALRYLNSPFGRPGYQLALTGAYKNYFRVDEAKSFAVALSGVRRLGQGFDVVAQYKNQWRDASLAKVQSAGVAIEQVAEIGFIFNFSATVNQHLNPRRSLLNQQHQYIPN